MVNKFKVAFATGSRAEYGIVRRYLSLLNNDDNIDLCILVTGSLLEDEYGHQVDIIKNDGFFIEAEIDIKLNSKSNGDVIFSMAIALNEFGQYFEEHKYDLLIILGDRFEMLSVATAAAMQRIPILHIHGGEATYGNYDEFIRHAITKMSLYHFAATEKYRQRIIQLGEEPSKVFYLGALGAENCTYIEEDNIPEKVRGLTAGEYFAVLFHPETLTKVSARMQIEELLSAIKEFPEYRFIFLGSNADTHSNEIRSRIKQYVEEHEHADYFENLPTAGYHYLLKYSLGLIGNSSSGIIEAPSLGIRTINIGSRQEGRVRGNSVHDIPCNRNKIREEISAILHKNIDDIFNPYYKENAACEYYVTTKQLLEHIKADTQNPKRFFDMKAENEFGS